ncbi:MAG TPA: hypothetical protein DEP84_36675 [Chloroflexi bacterium]|nr:hypothetical protein [Chloroflexota bacterium]
MVWHGIFGIERNVEALLSPTHLLEALGMWAMVSGPMRTAWKRSDLSIANNWMAMGPMLLSLMATMSGFMFMTQFAHPIHTPHALLSSADAALGVAAVLLQATILTGIVLLAVRRWTTLPFGSFTLVFTLNALAMATQHDHYALVPPAALAGLVADLLLRLTKPSVAQPVAFRLFAIGVPVVYYLFYFLALEITAGLRWTITLWGGAIVLAGIAGGLMSYLLVLPSGFVESTEKAPIR